MAAALVSLLILGILVWKTGVRLELVREGLRQADWGLLAATFAFSVAWHVFLGADKWWRILRGLGAAAGYWEVLRVRLGSDPIRFAMPLKSGELVNALYFGRRDELGFPRAAGSIAFDKALNFFGTVVWLYVGLAAAGSIGSSMQLALHSLVGLGVLAVAWVGAVRHVARAVALRLHPKLGRLAGGVLSAFEEFSPLKKLAFLTYGVVFQLRPLMVVALLFQAFPHQRTPTLVELLTFGSIVVLMSNVPLTIAGIGPREATLSLLFAGFADPGVLLGIGLMMSFSIHVIPAILGVPLMFPLVRQLADRTAAGQTGEPQS